MVALGLTWRLNIALSRAQIEEQGLLRVAAESTKAA